MHVQNNHIFKRKTHLDSHLKRKTPCNEKLCCETCSKKFNNMHNLLLHQNKTIPCINTMHECEYCQKRLSNDYSLERHMLVCQKNTNLDHIKASMLEQELEILKQTLLLYKQQQQKELEPVLPLYEHQSESEEIETDYDPITEESLNSEEEVDPETPGVSGVYFMFSGDKCKIGWSKHIFKRRDQGRTWAPDLRVHAYFPTYNPQWEKKIHEIFHEKRIDLEWFAITQRDAEEIVAQLLTDRHYNKLAE